jgi:hypothetical protein
LCQDARASPEFECDFSLGLSVARLVDGLLRGGAEKNCELVTIVLRHQRNTSLSKRLVTPDRYNHARSSPVAERRGQSFRKRLARHDGVRSCNAAHQTRRRVNGAIGRGLRHNLPVRPGSVRWLGPE